MEDYILKYDAYVHGGFVKVDNISMLKQQKETKHKPLLSSIG